MQCLSKKWIVFFILLLPCLALAQQEMQVRNYRYSVNEGLLQPTIEDAACDRYDRLWLSFPNGIQRFNGLYFETISVQEGLPDDKLVRFFQTKNGAFFILHSKGISLYNEQANSLKLVCKNSFDVAKPHIKFLGEWDRQLYISGKDCFYVFDIQSFKVRVVKVSYLYKGNIPDKGSNIYSNIRHGLIFVHNMDRWALMSLRDFSIQRFGTFNSRISTVWQPLLRADTTVLLADLSSKFPLQIWSPFKKAFIGQVAFTLPSHESFLRRFSYWNDQLFFQADDMLLQLNDKMQLERKLVNSNSTPASEGMRFQKMISDCSGNHFLISITDGFIMIPSYRLPLRYFRNKEQLNNDNVLSIAVDKKRGRVVTTGTKGISVFDTNQQRLYSLKKITSLKNFCVTQIVSAPDGGYVFTSFAPFAVWQCNPSLGNVKKMNTIPDIKMEIFRRRYFTKTLLNNDFEAILAQENALIRIDWNSRTASCQRFPRIGYTMSAHLQNSQIWMHAEDSLYFIDNSTFKINTVRYFPHTGNVRCYTSLRNGYVAMGTNKGVFILDKNAIVKYKIDKSKGLPDECIYSVEEDEDGNLWCGSNKGILKIGINSITQYTKDDGLLENEFNTNVSIVASDGELYFGGVNGVNSFYPSQIHADKENPELRLVGIEINNEPAFLDQSLNTLDKISLPYNRNSLSFQFIAKGQSHPSKYIYQYRISKLEEKWQKFLSNQSLRFLLPPGTYQLQVAATRSFQQDPHTFKTITIEISPPLWRTYWFLSLCFLGFLGVVIFISHQYIRRHILEQNVKLESEKKFQAEKERISRDLHDNIGAYANALLYITELIETDINPLQREEYVRDIKFAAKDIVISLREAVWALQQDVHTAEEIFIRLKNFIQSMRNYYPDIKFQLLGYATANLKLHSQTSLHIIRVVQEAATNAVKHSDADTISLKSEVDEEGYWSMTIEDNGKGFDWEQIREHNLGNGLSNMQYRAEQAAIRLEINSNSHGTKIKISYPRVVA